MVKELNCDFIFSDLKSSVKTIDYGKFSGYRKSLRHIKLPFGIYHLIGVLKEARKYNTIITSGDLHALYVWIILFYGKLSKKEVYLWTHGWYGREGRLKALVKRCMYSLAKKIFVYGYHAKELMLQHSFPEDKIVVISNSLDHEKQVAIRSRLRESNIYSNHFKNDYPTLIFTGRLTKDKNLRMILDALADLEKQGILVNLVFVGDGEERKSLEEKSVALNLEKRIWFFGSCYEEESIAELFYNASICVSPGNIGLTAIHAMTYGCPAITHNNPYMQGPEFEAIVEGITGAFFNYDDVNSLANTIKDWLEKTTDKDSIRKTCHEAIDSRWTPSLQIKIFKKTLLE